jgi:hypothetical protein
MTAGNVILMVFFAMGVARSANHLRSGSWDTASMFALGCTLIMGIALAHSLYESRRGDATEQLPSE